MLLSLPYICFLPEPANCCYSLRDKIVDKSFVFDMPLVSKIAVQVAMVYFH